MYDAGFYDPTEDDDQVRTFILTVLISSFVIFQPILHVVCVATTSFNRRFYEEKDMIFFPLLQ